MSMILNIIGQKAIKLEWTLIKCKLGSSYHWFHWHDDTVGPRLSESPLSEPSVIWILFQILKSFDFQQSHVINGMPVWYLDLLGLLYHSTVDRKAY